MQGAHQAHQQQQQQYPMSSAELWDAVQRQQAAQQGGAQYGMMHGGGAMAPLPSYEMAPAAGAGPQPLVLPGKPLPSGTSFYPQQHGASGGITGVPSSLTSLPGVPYSTTPSPPPGVGAQPQLYGGGSPSLGVQGAPGGYPQLSGLRSQLSSGMVLGGMAPGAHLVPNQHLGHPGGPSLMRGQQQQAAALSVPVPVPINTQPLVKMDPEETGHPSSSHSGAGRRGGCLPACLPPACHLSPPAACPPACPKLPAAASPCLAAAAGHVCPGAACLGWRASPVMVFRGRRPPQLAAGSPSLTHTRTHAPVWCSGGAAAAHPRQPRVGRRGRGRRRRQPHRLHGQRRAQ